MRRVMAIAGPAAAVRAAPMLCPPVYQRLRTSSPPSIATVSTRSACRASPSMASSAGMSVARRNIRLACVLFGTVRSSGKTSERSSRKALSAPTPQRRTQAMR